MDNIEVARCHLARSSSLCVTTLQDTGVLKHDPNVVCINIDFVVEISGMKELTMNIVKRSKSNIQGCWGISMSSAMALAVSSDGYTFNELNFDGITNEELESIWRIVEVSCTALSQPNGSRLASMVNGRSLNGFTYFTESRSGQRRGRIAGAAYVPTPNHGSALQIDTSSGKTGMATFAGVMLADAVEACSTEIGAADTLDRFTSFFSK
jgi:hypothetical protein